VTLLKTKRPSLTKEEIEQKLNELGIQATLQRIALARHILCEADHPTAEEVKSWADANLEKISQATIYNTLNTFVESGLLRAFRFPHSDKMMYDCNTEDHFHFLDEKSGQIYDIHTDDVGIKIEIPRKFKVKSMDLIIKGEIKNN